MLSELRKRVRLMAPSSQAGLHTLFELRKLVQLLFIQGAFVGFGLFLVGPGRFGPLFLTQPAL